MSKKEIAGFRDLELHTVEALQRCAADEAIARSVIRQYLDEGYRLGMTSGELIDCFCVSAPSLLEQAGLSEQVQDRFVAIFDEVHVDVRRKRR